MANIKLNKNTQLPKTLVEDVVNLQTELDNLTQDISTKVEEAPIDGKPYVRQDGEWLENEMDVSKKANLYEFDSVESGLLKDIIASNPNYDFGGARIVLDMTKNPAPTANVTQYLKFEGISEYVLYMNNWFSSGFWKQALADPYTEAPTWLYLYYSFDDRTGETPGWKVAGEDNKYIIQLPEDAGKAVLGTPLTRLLEGEWGDVIYFEKDVHNVIDVVDNYNEIETIKTEITNINIELDSKLSIDSENNVTLPGKLLVETADEVSHDVINVGLGEDNITPQIVIGSEDIHLETKSNDRPTNVGFNGTQEYAFISDVEELDSQVAHKHIVESEMNLVDFVQKYGNTNIDMSGMTLVFDKSVNVSSSSPYPEYQMYNSSFRLQTTGGYIGFWQGQSDYYRSLRISDSSAQGSSSSAIVVASPTQYKGWVIPTDTYTLPDDFGTITNSGVGSQLPCLWSFISIRGYFPIDVKDVYETNVDQDLVIKRHSSDILTLQEVDVLHEGRLDALEPRVEDIEEALNDKANIYKIEEASTDNLAVANKSGVLMDIDFSDKEISLNPDVLYNGYGYSTASKIWFGDSYTGYAIFIKHYYDASRRTYTTVQFGISADDNKTSVLSSVLHTFRLNKSEADPIDATRFQLPSDCGKVFQNTMNNYDLAFIDVHDVVIPKRIDVEDCYEAIGGDDGVPLGYEERNFFEYLSENRTADLSGAVITCNTSSSPVTNHIFALEAVNGSDGFWYYNGQSYLYPALKINDSSTGSSEVIWCDGSGWAKQSFTVASDFGKIKPISDYIINNYTNGPYTYMTIRVPKTKGTLSDVYEITQENKTNIEGQETDIVALKEADVLHEGRLNNIDEALPNKANIYVIKETHTLRDLLTNNPNVDLSGAKLIFDGLPFSSADFPSNGVIIQSENNEDIVSTFRLDVYGLECSIDGKWINITSTESYTWLLSEVTLSDNFGKCSTIDLTRPIVDHISVELTTKKVDVVDNYNAIQDIVYPDGVTRLTSKKYYVKIEDENAASEIYDNIVRGHTHTTTSSSLYTYLNSLMDREDKETLYNYTFSADIADSYWIELTLKKTPMLWEAKVFLKQLNYGVQGLIKVNKRNTDPAGDWFLRFFPIKALNSTNYDGSAERTDLEGKNIIQDYLRRLSLTARADQSTLYINLSDAHCSTDRLIDDYKKTLIDASDPYRYRIGLAVKGFRCSRPRNRDRRFTINSSSSIKAIHSVKMPIKNVLSTVDKRADFNIISSLMLNAVEMQGEYWIMIGSKHNRYHFRGFNATAPVGTTKFFSEKFYPCISTPSGIINLGAPFRMVFRVVKTAEGADVFYHGSRQS